MSATTSTGKARAPRRRRKRGRPPPRESHASYVVAIDDWDWSFHFGVNPNRKEDEAYSDYRHLDLRGRLIVPAGLPVDQAELTLIPSEMTDGAARPEGIGGVRVYDRRFIAYLGMPPDALAPVLTMLVARRIRFAALDGEPLRYRHAMIRGFRLGMAIDEDDLLPARAWMMCDEESAVVGGTGMGVR